MLFPEGIRGMQGNQPVLGNLATHVKKKTSTFVSTADDHIEESGLSDPWK